MGDSSGTVTWDTCFIAVGVLLAASIVNPADASPCKRTCGSGDIRDARGCCVPKPARVERAPRSLEEKRAPRGLEEERAPRSLEAIEVERAARLNAEGERLWREHKDPKALDLFQEAALADRKARYFYNLCRTSYELGRHQHANNQCLFAVKLDRDDEELHRKIDALRASIAEQLAAMGYATQVDQTRAASRLSLEGVQALEKRKNAAAAELFLQAVLLDPRAVYYHNLCKAQKLAGMERLAGAACHAALSRWPSDDVGKKVHRLLAEIRKDLKVDHLRMGDRAERARRLDREGTQSKDLADAKERFQEAVLLSPRAAHYHHLCDAHYQLGEYMLAASACLGALSQDPSARTRSAVNAILDNVRKRVK